MSIELVKLEVLRTLDDTDAAQGHRRHNRAFAPANGAIAAAGIDDAIRQIQL
jgi:hypothetical protein